MRHRHTHRTEPAVSAAVVVYTKQEATWVSTRGGGKVEKAKDPRRRARREAASPTDKSVSRSPKWATRGSGAVSGRLLIRFAFFFSIFFLLFYSLIHFFFVSEKMFGHSHGTTLEIMRFRDLIDVKLNWSRKSSWWVDCEQFGRSCAVKFGVCLSRSVACALLASSRPLVSRLAAALSAADENNQSAGVWLLSGARCARPQLVVFSHKELTSELFWWRRKSQKNGRGRKGNNMCELLFNKRQTLSI